MRTRLSLLAFALTVPIIWVSCGFSGIKVSATKTGTPADGYVLMSADEGDVPAFATDTSGKIVWQYKFDTHGGDYHPIPIQPLPNGNVIVVSAKGSGISVCDDCPSNNLIQEIDPSGNLVWQLTNQQLQDELTTSGYSVKLAQISHEAIGLPNGHLMVLASNLKTVTLQSGDQELEGAVLIDLDANHRPVWVWDAFDHLDVNRHPYFKLPDWIHGNAITYSPDDGNLLFSTRAQSWVIKIDYRNGTGNGAVIWRLGYEGDFALANGGPSDWFYGQHAPIFLTPNTTGVFELGLFDNGNGRVLNDTGAHCGDEGQAACYSTVPIFRIDENNMTAEVIWRDTLPFFSSAVGNMQVLPNGNVWFDAGRVDGDKAIIREVTREDNPQTVLEMRVNTIVYRAIHVPGSALGIQ